MTRANRQCRSVLIALAALLAAAPLGAQGSKPTIAQYIGTSEPLEVVSAEKTDRIAWISYDRGMRNVYTAAAPDFKTVRLTNFMEDNGVDLTGVSLSADGSTAVFVRGGAANRQGWIADPGHDPDGGDRAIWAVHTTGGAPAVRVAEGQGPTVSPDGRWVLYVKDNQIFRARTTKEAPPTRMDTGGIPFIKLWGSNTQPHWSPDGSKIAFVSARENHSFIGLYDVKTRKVTYVSPSTDCDGSPTWSADSKSIAFLRRPGTPFGMQAQQGNGGIGNPGGPAAAAAAGGRGAAAGLRRIRRSRRWWWRWRWRRWRRWWWPRRPRWKWRCRADAVARIVQRDVPRRVHALDVRRRYRDRENSRVLAQ